jgi:ATP-dependent DNA helicase RecQ
VSSGEIAELAPRLPASKLRVILAALKQGGLIIERKGSRYEVRPQLFADTLDTVVAAYDERRQRDQSKLEQMVIYAQTALCRTRLLLDALGESVDWANCGTCDNCRGLAVRAEGAAEGAA